jgi:hypothetical protein
MQFTRVALLLLATSCLMNSPVLGGVAVATQWGVVASFTCAPVFDPTVYARMRRKHGWSIAYFYVGHILLHLLPLWFAIARLARPTRRQSAIAVGLHGAWFAFADLDRLYVPLRDGVWLRLFAIAVVAELACAC